MKWFLLWAWVAMAAVSALKLECQGTRHSPVVNVLMFLAAAPLTFMISFAADECKWGGGP